MIDLELMVRQYLVTILWAENDNANENGGEPLEFNYNLDDFAPESLEKANKDCEKFLELAGDLVKNIDKDESDIGHDFWLTRNGHGAGFWDGDYPDDIGEKLTEISKKFSSLTPVVGDDGLIYLE